MTPFVLAALAALLAVVALTVRSGRAERAASDCITAPNSAAPKGSHWYYRMDRKLHRRCWFLGLERTKTRQVAQPIPPLPPPRPAAQPATEIVTQSTAGEHAPAAAFSTRWPDHPGLADSIARETPSSSDSHTSEDAVTDSQEEMPLVWPVLSAAELQPADRSPNEATGFTRVLASIFALLASALALLAALGRIFARRRGRRDADNRSGSRVDVPWPRRHASWGFANAASAAKPAEFQRKSVAATRLAYLACDPPRVSDPEEDIEETLQRLLHDWERVAARSAA